MSSSPSRSSSVPDSLVDAAGWTWRVLVLLAGVWVLFEGAKMLYLVTLPFAAGILLAALGNPAVAFLRRRGLPGALATLVAACVLFAVIGGIGTWVVSRAVAQAPVLVAEVSNALSALPITSSVLNNLRTSALDLLNHSLSRLTGPVVTGLTTIGEFATGILITIFVALYLLARGEAVWDWVTSLAPRRRRSTLQRMGMEVWRALSGWVRGTVIIAAFHGIVVAITLEILGVPLAISLALLVFAGAFIPIVGAAVVGAFAVLVTFAAQGLAPAGVFLTVLLVEDQIEAHILQPFLVGRYVRLNALAIVAALTAGGLLWGIAGAALAVPLTAAIHAALAARRPTPAPPAFDEGEESKHKDPT